MNRFIRYFNQNRVKVVIIILIIAFIIFLIYTINNILKRVNDNVEYGEPNTVVDTSRPTESVITGEEIPEETVEENSNIIEQFVEYGNAGDYQSAYNLLTEDCKQEVFNDLDSFIIGYCNEIFRTKKIYQLELWFNVLNLYTYRITYIEDNIMQTGSLDSSNNIEDYITVKTIDNEKKLSIGGLIEKTNETSSESKNGITITINSRTRYRSIEEYNITLINATNTTVVFSEGINSNDICLKDNNDTEYDIVLSEIPNSYLELAPGEMRTLDMRFYKMYNPYRRL